MARKTVEVTIEAAGRDQGKVFLITEKDAESAEEWAGRALFALMNAGVEIPENIAGAGLAGIWSIGLKAITKLPFAAAKPLLDEMMACVQISPSRGVLRAPTAEGDIEEVATRLTLRKAIWALHTDFFTPGAGSTSAPA